MPAKDDKNSENGLYRLHLDRDEFDVKMGGGIPKGSLALFEGQEGSGRSVICQRMCYGFLSNGHSVTYISTEMTVKDFIDQMYSLDYQIADHLLERRLVYVPVYPLIGETKPRFDFLERLMDSDCLYQSDIIIIDSLSSLIQHSAGSNGCLLLLGFLKKMASQGKTIILTIGEDDTQVAPLRLASDVYLALKIKVSGDGVQRMVQVKRFIRARGRVQDMILYRIEPMVGLVIELTEVSG